MTTLIPREQLTTLPSGYSSRPLRIDDADAVVPLYNASLKARSYGEIMTRDELLESWGTPKFSLEKSSQLILTSDEMPVGVVIVWDRLNLPVHPWIEWQVHPDHAELSRWLLEWGIERAQQAVDRCPPEARVSARTEVRSGCLPVETLYEALNFSPIRHFYRMRIDLTEAPAVTPLPAGFTLRTFQHPADLIALIEARAAAFRDHFGFFERPLEEMIPDWEHMIASDRLFDASLWYLVIDDQTGQIAGFVMSRIEDFDDPEVAYVDVVGVVKAYRKRGLASFLLKHSFAEFWKRGRTSTALHVDAQNTTGALRLYQNVGMHIERDYTDWEKELRPGVEMTNLAESSNE